jgi:hypothetical protein
VYRFARVSTEGDALGPVAFARGDWKPGDIIPQGPGRSLRVTAVIDPEPDDPPDRIPLLVVEPAE